MRRVSNSRSAKEAQRQQQEFKVLHVRHQFGGPIELAGALREPRGRVGGAEACASRDVSLFTLAACSPELGACVDVSGVL